MAAYQRDQALIEIFDDATVKSFIKTGGKYAQHGSKAQALTGLGEQIEEGLKRGR